MHISILIWFCCFVVISGLAIKTILNSVDALAHTYNDDTLLIKGHFVNSSDIQTLMNNRTIQKVYVYVVNTFYIDVDLEIRGIRELQIFANTWIISRAVTFDLSGLDGEYQAPSTVKGSAGYYGKAGMTGGNFLGLASEVVNGDFLTVKLHGGNGGDGQDGTASDDIQVTFKPTNGDNDWFSAADLNTYYQNYFTTRGYDPVISNIEDNTSLYARLVQNKSANLRIRLHPLHCCGKTGKGGVGGPGGSSGNFFFVNVGHGNIKSSPQFLTKHGETGNSGNDAKPCMSTALDIRVATKLENVVFISIPVHHSFSSEFFYVGHINSSKCPIEYVKGNEAVFESEEHKIVTVLSIIEYKAFLLEQMKNRSVAEIIKKTIHEIDSNSEINNEYTINDFVIEANALEKHFLDLRLYVNFEQLYERLSKRIETLERRTYQCKGDCDYSSSNPFSVLKKIFTKALNYVSEYLIFNIESYFESEIPYIKLINERELSRINDLDLRAQINHLQLIISTNRVWSSYFIKLNSYKLTFFPFAALYLERYQLSPSLQTYNDIKEIVSATTSNLESMIKHIPEMIWYSKFLVINKTSLDNNDPQQYIYKWKNSEVRNEIRRLFSGEKIRLFADIKKSEKQLSNQFNAFQFNEVNLVFRSSNQTINNQLNEALARTFGIDLTHSGESDFRCNDDLYRINSAKWNLYYCPPRNGVTSPVCTSLSYIGLQENRPLLSPYTLWEVKLEVNPLADEVIEKPKHVGVPYSTLEKFLDVADLDLELHCSGKYLKEDASICNDSNIANSYSLL